MEDIQFGVRGDFLHPKMLFSGSSDDRVLRRRLLSELCQGSWYAQSRSRLILWVKTEFFRNASQKIDKCFEMYGETFNNIRYADDTMLLADSLEGLKKFMNKV